MRPYTPDDAARAAELDAREARLSDCTSTLHCGCMSHAPLRAEVQDLRSKVAEVERLRATVARVEALSWEMSPEQGRRVRAALEGDR